MGEISAAMMQILKKEFSKFDYRRSAYADQLNLLTVVYTYPLPFFVMALTVSLTPRLTILFFIDFFTSLISFF